MRLTRRLVVVWPWLPEYRLSFFQRARERLLTEGISLFVATGDTPPSVAAREDTVEAEWRLHIPTDWVRLGRRELPYMSAGRLLRETSPDFMVVNHSLRYTPLFLRLKAMQRSNFKLGLWGHAVPYNAPHTPLVLWGKLKVSRLASWYFAYSEAGVQKIVESGFPRGRTTALNNTLDTDELSAWLDSVDDGSIDSFRERHSLRPGRTALFLGGIDDAKDFDYIASVASHLHDIAPDFSLVLAGSGDRLQDAKRLQSGGLPLVVLGRVQGVDKAVALKAADVLCIPSGVGLVAVDALFSGRGILSRQNTSHGPEIDYLPEQSIELLPAATHPVAFAQRLVDLAADQEWKRNASGAAAATAPAFTIESMVDRFVQGVLAWDRAGG